MTINNLFIYIKKVLDNIWKLTPFVSPRNPNHLIRDMGRNKKILLMWYKMYTVPPKKKKKLDRQFIVDCKD